VVAWITRSQSIASRPTWRSALRTTADLKVGSTYYGRPEGRLYVLLQVGRPDGRR